MLLLKSTDILRCSAEDGACRDSPAKQRHRKMWHRKTQAWPRVTPDKSDVTLCNCCHGRGNL